MRILTALDIERAVEAAFNKSMPGWRNTVLANGMEFPKPHDLAAAIENTRGMAK